MSDELPTLPALRGLGKLADLRPTVVVDSREQTPLVFSRLPSVVGTLKAGDYSALGIEDSFAVERKSIADLVSCCVNSNRNRFEWELHRLSGYKFKRLVVVGQKSEIERGEYRSQLNPKVVFSTLSAFEVRYQIPFVFFDTPEDAAFNVERWVYWFSREIVENANTLLRGASAENES